MIFVASVVIGLLLMIVGLLSYICASIRPRRPRRSEITNKPVIVPSDASAALIHKALRHLVNGCETHMAVCPYKEESLDGLIAFSREVLTRDMTSAGIMRMANLEDQLQQSQTKYSELVKIIHNPEKLEEYLKKECLCGTRSQCQQHSKSDKLPKL